MTELTPFEIDAALRLLAATVCGLAVGFNRDLKQKPTGMRTLGLVSLGACLVSLAGLQADPMRSDPDAMSRVVQGVLQGVMTGIGFIGAGVILKQPGDGTVRGLTTAATVWITAGLGVACALASWTIIALGVVLALLVLILPRKVAKAIGANFDDTD
ncbi:MgtC/SapB family protein [Methylopila sp. Yamaguchi]|uniref:MgtC/SapB family protein n=1 Tax=Methylopila sp. Yamaguchi TaxID=1437817 RepID=UPI000CCC403E|nr:MgtC/SapB family protein [Methylopila sp. Yamaguchi]